MCLKTIPNDLKVGIIAPADADLSLVLGKDAIFMSFYEDDSSSWDMQIESNCCGL